MRFALATAGLLAAIAALAVISRIDGPAPEPSSLSVAVPQPVTAAQARSLIAGGALLADVREPHELAATGKLKGALNVPLTSLKQLAGDGRTPAELAAHKDRPVILYCRSGRRSQQAGELLLRQGFTRVYNLGGFEDAVKAGLPAA